MDIGEWLRSIDLEEYEVAFHANKIDSEILPELTEGDLERLGMPLGHRKRLLKAIRAIGADESTPRRVATSATPPVTKHPRVDAAERRQLTVMFCDLVGSTALSAGLDAEDLREIIGIYQRCCVDEIERAGGFLAKYMGDGVLAYFGYPQAHEDDAERAVRAALALIEAVSRLPALHDARLQVRIGIATGVVVVGDLVGEGSAQEQGVVGETPNLAARLQSLAEPDQAVICQGTRRLTGGLFEYRDLGPVALKGFAKPVQAWQALRVSAMQSRFEARHESTLFALVGRQDEMELLLRRWQQAKNGDGQVVLLSGEPGIGKSRITAALQERLRSEPHASLRYFCSPHHRESAFHPFISGLERGAGLRRDDTAEQRLDKLEAALAPETTNRSQDAPLLAALLSISTEGRYPPLDLTPQKRKEKTLAALLAQVEGLTTRQPLLIVFEDLHWADPSSLDALDLIVDRLINLPVLLVVTFRPDFTSPWAGRSQATLLTLNRLPPRQQAEMIERVTDGMALPKEVVDQIIDHTDGIPLFLEELTKTVLESGMLRQEGLRYVLDGPLAPLAIPTTLHASLLARLDRLASVRDLAQIGAAIGRQFSYELISAVAALPKERLDESLDQLVNAALIFRRGTPPDAEYTFKHALVQDATYSSLLRNRRHQLHARIAVVLEERFPDVVEQQPELLAEHCTRAGLMEKAARLWRGAGHNAAKRAAHREASALFEKALSALAALPSSAETLGEAIDIRWDLHHSLYPLGELARGRANLETAEHFAEKLGDEVRLSNILSSLVYTLGSLGDLVGAVEAGERAHALAERRSDSDVQLRTNMMLARARYGRGDYERAAGHAQAALHLLSAGSGDGPRNEGYLSFGRVNARIWLVLCLAELGRFGEATVHGQEATEIARQQNGPEELIFAGLGVGRMQLVQGNLENAVEVLKPALALCKSAEFPIYMPRVSCSLGGAYALLGRIDEALVLFEAAVKQALAIKFMFGHSMVLSQFGRACHLAGRQDEAMAHAQDAINAARNSGERGNEAWACCSLGDLVSDGSTIGPTSEEAEEHYGMALAIADKLGMRPLRAHCLYGLSRLHGNAGNQALADKYASDAARLCREMDMRLIDPKGRGRALSS